MEYLWRVLKNKNLSCMEQYLKIHGAQIMHIRGGGEVSSVGKKLSLQTTFV